MGSEENKTVEYSGDISGDYSGDFEVTVDFEKGRVEGTFRGGGFGIDVTGSVSDKGIKAEGSVMGQTVKISGKVSEDRSSIEGKWEVPRFGSGEWKGTKSQ